MHALRTAIGLGWVAFWVYWLVSACGSKRSIGRTRGRPIPGLGAIVLVLVFGLRNTGAAVHSPALTVIGAAVFLAGTGVAIWARVNLGANWGMPTTQKEDPELVTTGPYRFVRHPIYSGLLLGLLGTALAENLLGLLLVALLGVYFVHSARVEERNLTASFPEAYPAYQAATKMLVPFVL
jgi:protein-S-isoprenylcysteine O-methyltransferase Ste14